jgi:tryptophan-rich sensory protein
MINKQKLIISLSLPLLSGFLGSFFTSSEISGWYGTLIKPSFNPPSWIFGPMWTLLYILMGISVYLIWSHRSFWHKKEIKMAVCLFWIHLFFNGIWSIIFFRWHQIGLAMFDIMIIWIFIIILIFKFWKINRLASYLLVPYFLWVSFASILNFSIWYLN